MIGCKCANSNNWTFDSQIKSRVLNSVGLIITERQIFNSFFISLGIILFLITALVKYGSWVFFPIKFLSDVIVFGLFFFYSTSDKNNIFFI